MGVAAVIHIMPRLCINAVSTDYTEWDRSLVQSEIWDRDLCTCCRSQAVLLLQSVILRCLQHSVHHFVQLLKRISVRWEGY